MSRDRSLDEFFSTDDERAASTPDAERETDADADEGSEATAEAAEFETEEAETEEVGRATDEEADEHDVETALPRATYRWSPEGDECPVCGTLVEQRWRDDDRFVCADCKEW